MDRKLVDVDNFSETNAINYVAKNYIKEEHYQIKPMWRKILFIVSLHTGGLCGLIYLFYCQYQTWLFFILLYWFNGLGITAGAHRLWAHRTYKARLPLQIFLMLCNCLALQSHVIEWARDHRTHHKFTETNGDPHNAKRGFFFAHMGWLMVKKHPDVISKGKTLDVSDLYNDKVLIFQRRFFTPLTLTICFVLPTIIPCFWGENVIISFLVCGTFRVCLTLHMTFLVNSAAHLWGVRPYDPHINPAENMYVASVALGEGFHNYHHVFPQDYTTSEFSWVFNPTTIFIDTMAVFGLAFDRKKVPEKTVLQYKQKAVKESSKSVEK